MRKIFTLVFSLLLAGNSFAQLRTYKVNYVDSQSRGYYFLSTVKAGKNAGLNENMILDAKGHIAYSQTFALNKVAVDFKIQPNGMMSYYYIDRFYLMDSNFQVVDTIKCGNGYHTNEHDLQLLPNGHYLILGDETDTVDLRKYNYFLGKDAPGIARAVVLSNIIQELDQDKKVVFEWHSKDHFSFDHVNKYWLNDTANVDWSHMNAVELDTDGNILASSRHFNEIFKINRKTGDVMWEFGGKYNQFNFLNDSLPFYGQHDIRRLPNGDITLFDDGGFAEPHAARAMEYKLDEANKTAKVTWYYTYDTAVVSSACGNVQRLKNGNTLVNYGILNNNKVTFAVVDSAGNKHFDLVFDNNVFSYRAFNYLNLPWRLKRPEIYCMDSAGKHWLVASPGFANYAWSSGLSSRIIEIKAPGTYYVSSYFGKGIMRSAPFVVTDINNLCKPVTGVKMQKANNVLLIYPNPAAGIINIELSESVRDVKISDLSGRYMNLPVNTVQMGNSIHLQVDVSSLKPGIYFINAGSRAAKFIKE